MIPVAFPKPKNKPLILSPIIVHRGGREVCNRMTGDGAREYKRRVEEMRVRQGERCCLWAYAPMCPGTLREKEATFEHERSRGGGKRDDRVSLPDGTWINGAAHFCCNSWKGSRYIDYNRGFQRAKDTATA